MGRESFRMEVVGKPATANDTDAVPNMSVGPPTERIIERRRSGERRRAPRVADAPVESPPTPAKNSIIAISLIFFVGGALVATAVDRLRRYVGWEPSTQAAQVQPAAAAPKAPPPAPAAAIVVQPLPKPAPEPVLAAAPEAIAPPVADAETRAPVVKVATAPRAAAVPALRPRRLAPPAAAARAPEAKATEPPAFGTSTRPTMKWVDPFAE
jgi:hypothetical protein